MSTTLLLRSEENFSQKDWHSHPKEKKKKKFVCLFVFQKIFHWDGDLQDWVLHTTLEKQTLVRFTLTAIYCSLITTAQWIGWNHRACVSLQEKPVFFIKEQRQKSKKKKRWNQWEGRRKREIWRNIILKSMCESSVVQLPFALKGFAQLKHHSSSWQYSHIDVQSEGVDFGVFLLWLGIF